MPTLLPLRSALGSTLAALTVLAGCGSDSGDAVEEPQVTGIVVSPEDFLGSIPCLDAPGAMRRYQVKLTHVSPARSSTGTGGEAHFEPDPPQRSQLLGCEQGVAFGNVKVGAGYTAEIVAFDQANVVEVGPDSFEDSVTRQPITPRWTGPCETIEADYQALRHVSGCRMDDSTCDYDSSGMAVCPIEHTQTTVLLKLDAASTGQECSEISHYEIVRDGETIEAACGDSVSFTLEPRERFDVELVAFDLDQDGEGGADEETAILGGRCFADSAPGATVTATCDPLQSKGGIEVPLQTLAEALGAPCSELTNLSVTLADEMMTTIDVARPACTGSLHFSSVEPGEQSLDVSALRGGAPLSASCSAEVRPGLVARAHCDAG